MPSNAAYTPPHPLANGGTGGAQNIIQQPVDFVAAGPNGSHDDVAHDWHKSYSVAREALDRMFHAYNAIGFKKPECRMARKGDHWYAYCSGTTGCGDTPKKAVRQVAEIWSRGMMDTSWVDALVRNEATPDEIRDLAEAISAAIDATSEDSP